jgi:hypothetical protein
MENAFLFMMEAVNDNAREAPHGRADDEEKDEKESGEHLF